MAFIPSVQIWTCPCGANYRAECDLPRGSIRMDDSTVICHICGAHVRLDGKLKKLSYELRKDQWIEIQSGTA